MYLLRSILLYEVPIWLWQKTDDFLLQFETNFDVPVCTNLMHLKREQLPMSLQLWSAKKVKISNTSRMNMIFLPFHQISVAHYLQADQHSIKKTIIWLYGLWKNFKAPRIFSSSAHIFYLLIDVILSCIYKWYV